MAFRCPICKREALPRARNADFPFCSARCRALDLGRWLGAEYKIPDTSSADADEDGQGTPASADDRDEDNG